MDYGESIQRQAIITCPYCGWQQTEIMPLDACLYFYTCPGCQRALRPKAQDCCVFCSFGTIVCPPRQTNPRGAGYTESDPTD